MAGVYRYVTIGDKLMGLILEINVEWSSKTPSVITVP